MRQPSIPLTIREADKYSCNRQALGEEDLYSNPDEYDGYFLGYGFSGYERVILALILALLLLLRFQI